MPLQNLDDCKAALANINNLLTLFNRAADIAIENNQLHLKQQFLNDKPGRLNEYRQALTTIMNFVNQNAHSDDQRLAYLQIVDRLRERINGCEEKVNTVNNHVQLHRLGNFQAAQRIAGMRDNRHAAVTRNVDNVRRQLDADRLQRLEDKVGNGASKPSKTTAEQMLKEIREEMKGKLVIPPPTSPRKNR